jgi:hypothetical protein
MVIIISGSLCDERREAIKKPVVDPEDLKDRGNLQNYQSPTTKAPRCQDQEG